MNYINSITVTVLLNNPIKIQRFFSNEVFNIYTVENTWNLLEILSNNISLNKCIT